MPADLQSWARALKLKLPTLHQQIRAKLRVMVLDAKAKVFATAPKRTGRLALSVFASLGHKQIRIGAKAPYARIIEDGGTILPTKGKYLAIPLRPGLPKRGPRGDGKLILFKSRDGRLFLARRNGKQIDVRWKLQTSVVRKAKPFVKPVAEDLAIAIPGAIGEHITTFLKRKV